MKVAAYIRVSTEEQVQEGYSIAAQRNRLEAYAISQGWEIVQYYVDEGISAKDMNRPELQRMLNNIKEGMIDCVLVYRLDRLTRSVLDLYQLLNTFEKHNTKFKSATEVYDTTTATGRLFLTLIASLAQWERENLGERVRMGMLQKAKEGKWVTNIAPFGYDIDGDHLKINAKEAAVVKEIFSLYQKGYGMHKIAASLNERGILTKKGKHWQQNSISYVLTNPTYMGNMRYNYRVNSDQYFEVDGVIPEIISEQEFEAVQQIIEGRKKSHPRQATSKFIFSKVLKCARCGSTLVGKISSTKRGDKTYYSYNYYCLNRPRAVCDLPMINENLFEQKFIQLMENFDFEKGAREIIIEDQQKNVTDYTLRIKQLESELKEIESRRSKWQYAWVNEMINDVDFKKRMDEEKEKEKMILKELEDLKPKESPAIDNIPELLANVKLNWDHMTKEEKKQFILLAVDRIVVDRINKHKSPDSYVIKEVKFN